MNAAQKLPDHLFDPVTDEDQSDKDNAKQMLKGFLGKRADKPKPRKKSTIPDSAWQKALNEAREMRESGDWSAAHARHFVALYTQLHVRVYGVPAFELDGSPSASKARLHATGAALRVLEREFNGDTAMMAEFMRWVWNREIGREKWRREQAHSGGRISWNFQFDGGKLVTDWRLDHQRTIKPGK